MAGRTWDMPDTLVVLSMEAAMNRVERRALHSHTVVAAHLQVRVGSMRAVH